MSEERQASSTPAPGWADTWAAGLGGRGLRPYEAGAPATAAGSPPVDPATAAAWSAGPTGERPAYAAPSPTAPPPLWGQGASDPWRNPVTQPIWVPPGSDRPPGPPVDDPYAAPDAPGGGRAVSLGLVTVVAAVVALLVGGVAGLGAYGIGRHRDTTVAAPDRALDTPLGTPATGRAPTSVAGIAAKLLPSVVSLEVAGGSEKDTGTAFVVRSDGYLVTNNHVVSTAATGGTVRAVFGNGTSTAATIVGRDPSSDLAVVKVSRTGLSAVSFGNSDNLAVGDPVVAIGSPLGLAGTVTSGIISALARPVKSGEGGGGSTDATASYLSAIQTDAAINPGNSGGPLVDADGQVIGVNSAIASLADPTSGTQAGNIGLGFAIPINQVKRIASELIRTGHATHSIIGASVTESGGSVRLAAVPTGPAQRAGLRAGDIVEKLEGRRVSGADDFIASIRSHSPGARVSVTVERGNRLLTVAVVLGAAQN